MLPASARGRINRLRAVLKPRTGGSLLCKDIEHFQLGMCSDRHSPHIFRVEYLQILGTISESFRHAIPLTKPIAYSNHFCERTGSSSQTTSYFLKDWRASFYIPAINHMRSVQLNRYCFWIFATRQNKFSSLGINLSGRFGTVIFILGWNCKVFSVAERLTNSRLYRRARGTCTADQRDIRKKYLPLPLETFLKRNKNIPFQKIIFKEETKGSSTKGSYVMYKM